MSEASGPRGLRVAFYGDDFTGSVDALLQFARGGWSGRLFVGLPSDAALAAAAAEGDVVGIAGIARSLPTSDLDAELRPVLTRLAALGPHVVQYKACSTADSSPEIGSLGRVIELGRELVASTPVPALFAQPDFGRYTAFGHHFAAEGGVVYRLDRQPTMSSHPVTPMTESDLAVHLGRQTDLAIGSVSYLNYASRDALASLLGESAAAALVLDALDNAQLQTIGEALLQLPGPVFAIGSGGLSTALASAAPGSGSALPTASGVSGPILAVSGSRSAQSRRQADAAAAAGWLVRPLPLGGTRADLVDGVAGAGDDRAVRGAGAGDDRAVRDADHADAVLHDVLAALGEGRSVVLTSDDAAVVDDRPVLEAIAEAAASVASSALRAGATRRVIVCGGDTSSRVVRLLGVESLSIAANPGANIVLLRADAPGEVVDGVELLLKGGQVGDVDLFDRIRALSS